MSPRLTEDLVADLVDAGSREHYSDPALYDYEYRRRRADVAWYRELARQRLGDSGRILELGAGSGRITIPLARAGYEVVAVDASKPMLDQLRARVAALPKSVARRISIIQADLRQFEIPAKLAAAPVAPVAPPASRDSIGQGKGKGKAIAKGKAVAKGKTVAKSKTVAKGKTVDALLGAPVAIGSSGKRAEFPLAIAVFNVLEHLYTRVELDACLRCVRDHLAPGGAFAFDVQLPDMAWLIRDPWKRWARTRFTDPATGRLTLYSTNHEYDPVSQIVLIRIYYEPVERDGPIRIVKLSQRKYFPAELEALVAHAGLRVVDRFGDFGWRPLDGSAESQVVVCERVIRAIR